MFADFKKAKRTLCRDWSITVESEPLTREQLCALTGQKFVPVVGLHTMIEAIMWRVRIDKRRKK